MKKNISTKTEQSAKNSVKKTTTTSKAKTEEQEVNKILDGDSANKKTTKKPKAKVAESSVEPKSAATEKSPATPKKETPKKPATETPAEAKEAVVFQDNGEQKQRGTTKSGKVYEIDTVKKTCKRVITSFDEINLEALNMDEMPMEVYQQYARDRYPDEEFPIKKNKLMFKGFRISCTADEGFKVEDTTQKYRVVDLPFDGIPSPKELCDYLTSPKASAAPKSEKKVTKVEVEQPEEPKVDFDDPKVCRKIINKELARLAKVGERLSIKEFSKLVPFKRWQRTVRKFYKLFEEKKIRYPKLVQMIVDYTKEETFEEAPQQPKYKFSGTILPEFKSVGMLLGDKLEVDGKKVDAVPFLVDYILHYVPKAMQQMMRWAEGVVTDVELLREPFFQDPYIEFNKKSVKSGSHNASVLSALCASIDLVAPQDMLYEADLKVGDKILLYNDGRWTTKTITSTDEGIEYGRGIGVMKFDKWLKVEPKEQK
jgi:hypothetical protein